MNICIKCNKKLDEASILSNGICKDCYLESEKDNIKNDYFKAKYSNMIPILVLFICILFSSPVLADTSIDFGITYTTDTNAAYNYPSGVLIVSNESMKLRNVTLETTANKVKDCILLWNNSGTWVNMANATFDSPANLTAVFDETKNSSLVAGNEYCIAPLMDTVLFYDWAPPSITLPSQFEDIFLIGRCSNAAKNGIYDRYTTTLTMVADITYSLESESPPNPLELSLYYEDYGGLTSDVDTFELFKAFAELIYQNTTIESNYNCTLTNLSYGLEYPLYYNSSSELYESTWISLNDTGNFSPNVVCTIPIENFIVFQDDFENVTHGTDYAELPGIPQFNWESDGGTGYFNYTNKVSYSGNGALNISSQGDVYFTLRTKNGSEAYNSYHTIGYIYLKDDLLLLFDTEFSPAKDYFPASKINGSGYYTMSGARWQPNSSITDFQLGLDTWTKFEFRQHESNTGLYYMYINDIYWGNLTDSPNNVPPIFNFGMMHNEVYLDNFIVYNISGYPLVETISSEDLEVKGIIPNLTLQYIQTPNGTFNFSDNITIYEYVWGTWSFNYTIFDNKIINVSTFIRNDSNTLDYDSNVFPFVYEVNSTVFIDFDNNPYTFLVVVEDSEGNIINDSFNFNVADSILPYCSGFDNSNITNNTNYTWDVYCIDENFYSFNLSCDNNFSYYIDGLNNITYSYSGSSLIKEITTCDWRVCDGHTKTELSKDFKAYRNITSKEVKVMIKDKINAFKLTSNQDMTVSIKNKKDRVSPVFSLNGKSNPGIKTYEFEYITSENAIYIESDE